MKTAQNYTNHTLNTSKAKAAFLFPKQKRFNYRTKNITESFYEIPSTINTRATTFGYGNKSPFGIKSSSPPPGTYNPPSDFKTPKNAISFAKGRENVHFGSFLSLTKEKKFVPSPDRYKIQSTYSKVSGKMFSRLPTELDLITKKKSPGPGAYEPKGCFLSNSGSYILSNMKNSISPRLHTQIKPTDRTMRKRNYTQLSPTTYNTMQKERGTYFNSKYKNVPVRSFGSEKRKGPEDHSKISFPGFKYKRFSDFGTYV